MKVDIDLCMYSHDNDDELHALKNEWILIIGEITRYCMRNVQLLDTFQKSHGSLITETNLINHSKLGIPNTEY